MGERRRGQAGYARACIEDNIEDNISGGEDLEVLGKAREHADQPLLGEAELRRAAARLGPYGIAESDYGLQSESGNQELRVLSAQPNTHRGPGSVLAWSTKAVIGDCAYCKYALEF